MNQLKTEVLEKLQARKSNLFTFMKAQPIISHNRSERNKNIPILEPVSDKYRSNFPFVSAIKKRLKKSNRNLQIKFDIFTKKAFTQTV